MLINYVKSIELRLLKCLRGILFIQHHIDNIPLDTRFAYSYLSLSTLSFQFLLLLELLYNSKINSKLIFDKLHNDKLDSFCFH